MITITLIQGKHIGQDIKNQVRTSLQQIRETTTISPKIATVMIGNNPESSLYLKLRDKACEEVGILSERIIFKETVTEKKVLEKIKELNENPLIHGILVQLPLPDQISEKKIFSTLSPIKDVEGFTPWNLGSLLNAEEHIIPCTPLAVLKILEHEKITLQGKNIVIVNHSMVVGKPLATLFLNRNATVSVCHVFTESMKSFTRKADILVTAAGVPRLITADMVKKDAMVIDVGIVQTDNGICGDVDETSVKEKAAKLTPVPGGVGPVTVACSLCNMVKTIHQTIQD